MNIELNLTKHAIEQLNLRYPRWSKTKLKKALKRNPTFTYKNQYHTYLGTGFDEYQENGLRRPTYKRRHLFLVSKKLATSWIQKTAVFHTSTSILLKTKPHHCKVFNNAKNPIEDPSIQDDNKKIWFVPQLNPLSLRNDIAWEYNEKLTIDVLNIN